MFKILDYVKVLSCNKIINDIGKYHFSYTKSSQEKKNELESFFLENAKESIYRLVGKSLSEVNELKIIQDGENKILKCQVYVIDEKDAKLIQDKIRLLEDRVAELELEKNTL